MLWDSNKVKKLKDYCGKKKPLSYRYTIPWKGSLPIEFPVYMVPTELLSFNFNNTRIRAELQGKYSENHNEIDSNKKENIEFVETILLASKWIGELETGKLTSDLIERGQLDPVVATPDGILIDGNRRLAIFRKRLREYPNDQDFAELKVCFLPDDATKDELKELEMRMQMYQNFRVDYGDINISLEFRSLYREFKWGFDRIANLTGNRYDEKKIEKMIEIIDMIDEYLNSVGDTKQYITVDRKWESFENLYRILSWSKKQSNISVPSDITQRKFLGFKIIRVKNSTFRDIRRFYSVLRNDEARKWIERRSATLNGVKLSNFSESHVLDELGVISDAEDFLTSIKQEPAKVVEQALKKLETIKISRIKKNDRSLAKALNKLLHKIELLKDKI